MPRAGRFRERAVIERDSGVSRDAHGQVAESWAALATLWCDFRETPGREAIEGGRLEGSATGTLRLRYSQVSSSITSADRVRLRGQVWNIRGQPIQIDNRDRIVELKLEAGVAAGGALLAVAGGFSSGFSTGFEVAT